MIGLAGVGKQQHVSSLASLAFLLGLMVLERDPDSEVGTMARQVLNAICNKMVVAERNRKGSSMFRSLS